MSTTTSSSSSSKPPPDFTFGVIADVQWADAPDGFNYAKTTVRRYRGSLQALEKAVNWWKDDLPQPPSFIAQLGDLIDGMNNPRKLNQSDSALQKALDQLNRAPCPSVNIIGNHELYNFNRKQLAEASWLKHGDKEYYSFAPTIGWRVIVLDPYQVALMGHTADDPRRLEAVKIVTRENPNVSPDGADGDWFDGIPEGDYRRRFIPYNGGYGQEQLEWFQTELTKAAAAQEKVVILSHIILHPNACNGTTMAWDYDQALDIIHSKSCVVAVLCGHNHVGNYHCDEHGIHHCTFISPLQKGNEGFAYGVIHMRSDSMEIIGPKMDDLLPNIDVRPPVTKCQGGGDYMPRQEYESMIFPIISPTAAAKN